MKNFFKGKFGTVIILFFTLILAGVAIFTALRLYQLRQQPVAPNVPSSIPMAQEVTGMCTLSFTVTPQNPGLSCSGKLAYKDDSRNAPPVYYLENSIAAGSDISPGQTIVYSVEYENTGTTAANSATLTDTLPANVNFIDGSTGCTYESSTKTISCSLGSVAAGAKSKKIFRITISETALAGSLINNAVLSATGVQNSECQISLNIQIATSSPTASPTETPTATPTVTPTATPNLCGGTCGSNNNCQSDYVCFQGFCRNPSCTEQATCSCPGEPNICGGTCGSDSNCRSGLTCFQGFCRNPSCTSQASCACPGTPAPTPPPTTPALPESGTDWPTIVGAGMGLFVIIGSLLLAL